MWRALYLLPFLIAPLAAQEATLANWVSISKRAAELDRGQKVQEAEAAYLQALAIAQKLDEPARVGSSYNNLGVFYFRNQRDDEGEKAFRKAIDAFEKADPASEDALSARGNLATLLISAGKFKDAREEADALIKAARYSSDDPRSAKGLLLIAQAEQGRGNTTGAFWNYRFALERLERGLPQSRAQLTTAVALANTYVVTVLDKLKPDSAELNDVEFLEPAAWLLARHGDAEAGRSLAMRAQAVHGRRFGMDSPASVQSACTLAAAHVALQQFAEAGFVLEGALALLQAAVWDETMRIPVYEALAEVHAKAGDQDKAAQAFETLIALHKQAFSASPVHIWRVVDDAARDAAIFGAPEVAEKLRAQRDALPMPPWVAAGVDETQVRQIQQAKSFPPNYPPQARSRGLEATVFVLALVDESGKVQAVHTLQGVGHGFDDATKTAVRTWKYEPESFEGKAYPTVKLVQVNYRLSR